MKKYFKMMWEMIDGYRSRYFFYFFIQFITVVLMVLSAFTAKILSDTISGDIFDPSKLGLVGSFIVYIYGGAEFLSNNMWMFAVIYLSIALVGGTLNFLRIMLRSYISSGIGKTMQLRLFYHVERLPYSFLKKCKSGDIIQTCTRDESVLRRFIVGQTTMITYTLDIVVLSFLILLSLSWKLALVSMVIMPILFIYSFFIIKEVRKRYRATDDSEGQMTSKIEENLNAVRIVKAYNNERYEIDDFEKYLDSYKIKYKHWRKLSAFFFSSSDIFVFGQILITFLFGIYLAIIKEISIGTFIVATTFSSMMVWPLRDVATILSDGARAIVSIDRMNLIFDEPMEDIYSGEKPPIKGEIEFENVTFKYDDGNENVLDGINLKIKPGQTIAVMGKTGVGKTTIAQLLTRLYETTSGTIKLDGHNIDTIAKSYLRENISCVLQEPFLFSKTIMNNIKIAELKADEKRVFEAASVAAIDEDIRNFKEGYETPVGENGVTLSGGQKQRVAIARALISEAPILIFDDSLSAVDTETDIKIRKALAKRNQNKAMTTIIITHRVATAFDADNIVIIEGGKIVQEGKHDKLSKEEGLYKRILDIQTRMV
ncbi:MAG: ABC transporter ATP-binding protein/permease [Erysipelotrichaceae bacterium]|jgi:ATP-binding cassette subfamily B protein|nr:ABC transporter ATP-binding protein/permease [Erysipelotrichaceae bacterium]